jgi:tetratricopeptide (TPR) repeat protein
LKTSPHILKTEVSQIVWPVPDRFSIAHDVVISTSLVKPWTTLPSMILVFALIGFALAQVKKRPILSFSILFFFLNHIIESSIIGLEIIFEHRNYLPSLFLFLPPAVWFVERLNHNREKNRRKYGLLLFLIIALIACLSVSTHIRNRAWKDDLTLWQDALEKAPNNARALNIIAIRLAFGEESKHPRRYDMALKMFAESLEKHLPSTYVKADIHYNMALIYFHHKEDPEAAYRHFIKALQIHPENLKIRRKFAETMVLNEDFAGALEQADRLLAKKEDSGRYLALKGHILLWLGDCDGALHALAKAYPRLFDKSGVILDMSACLSRKERFRDAERLLTEAIENHHENLVFYLAAIENSVRAGEMKKAAGYADAMVDRYGRAHVERAIDDHADNPRYAPLSKEVLISVVERAGT